ncbi:class I SAM-dependent methyltransferase [Aquimarina sp. 2201CG1-2-11]|uniref:class I SAM-dependent methyltransferase n=1 Tax=Aquimarina discodermiae TaxID=3231043 RepID=UPI0034624917
MNVEKELTFFLECKDYTVSKDKFKLLYDAEYDMLITVPKPSENDLGKYYESEDYISHTDAKRSIFEKLYHSVKTYAIRKKVELLYSLDQKTGDLLDIGAGTGDFLSKAKSKGWNVTGIEPNESARELAKQKSVFLKDTTKNIPDESFDIITMWHVLEHVPNVKEQIRELKRLLKPNGYVIIAVPNFKSYDANYYKSFWAAYDVPRHLTHFSKASIQKLFNEKNLALQKVLPMRFDSYYVALLSEKYKTNNMNFLKAFCVGFFSNIKGRATGEYSSHIYVLKNH